MSLPPPPPAPPESEIAYGRLPGPMLALLWIALVVGGYLWAGRFGLVFTGACALMVAGMVMLPARWRPKGRPKTWYAIFWSCWGVLMYSGTGKAWYLTVPAVYALAWLTARRYWPPKGSER